MQHDPLRSGGLAQHLGENPQRDPVLILVASAQAVEAAPDHSGYLAAGRLVGVGSQQRRHDLTYILRAHCCRLTPVGIAG